MAASPSVLAAVRGLSHPIEAQAFLAALTEGEGGDLPNRLYGGGELRTPNNPNIGTDANGRIWKGSLDVFPDWGGAWLSQNGAGDYSTAAGVLQFTGTTWRRVSPITGRKTFSIEDQLENGWWLASDDFLRRSHMDLLGILQSGMLALIPTFLGTPPKANTWPGGASSTFPKRYTANLAALKAPAPAPAPPAPDPAATYPASGQLVMKDGKPSSMTITFGSIAAAVLGLLPVPLGK
jgi:hypothetical protein